MRRDLFVRLLFLLCFSYSSTFAQGKISFIKGHITTKDGHPAPYISVSVKNTSFGNITDENGNFQIRVSKPGSYVVAISSVGVTSQEKNVEVHPGETVKIDFAIDEAYQQLHDIEVKGMGSKSYTTNFTSVGSKFALPQKDIPNSVSVITRQFMNDLNMFTLTDALNQATGITAVSYGDGSSYFQSRGFPLQIQFDGLPSTEGLQYQSQFDLAMYDNIQILRGPAGVTQGASSAAGVLSLNRKMPLDSFGIAGAITAGSFKNFRGNIDVSLPIDHKKKLKSRFVVSADDRGYSIKEQHSKHYLLYGVLRYDISDRTSVTLSGNFEKDNLGPLDYGAGINEKGQFIDAPHNTFFGTPWSYTKGNMSEVYADVKHRFSNNWSAKIAFDYKNYANSANYGYPVGPVFLNDTIKYSGQIQDLNISWMTVDASVNGTFNLFGRKQQVAVGINYANNNKFSLSSNKTYTGINIYNINIPQETYPYKFGSNTSTAQYGVYAQTHLQLLDRLSLSLGGRLSNYRNKNQNLIPTVGEWEEDPKTSGVFTPFAGVVYEITRELSAYGSYSNVFTPQTQLTQSGKALKPEQGNQYEVGLKGGFFNNRLNASVAGFLINDQNRAIPDPAAPTFYVANGKVRSKGIEVELTGNITPELSVVGGYTYLENKYITDPANQGKIFSSEEPNNTYKLWANYLFSKGALKNLSVGLGGRTVSSANRGYAVQEGYTLVNGRIGYAFMKKWSIGLNVNNIFDQSYYARIPSSYFGIFGESRNFMVTLRKDF